MPDFPFVPYNMLPEEFREHVENAQAQAEISVSATRHEVIGMFDDLSNDHLRTLMLLFSSTLASDDPTSAGNFYHGYMLAILHARGICAACGTNHEDVLEDGLAHKET